MPEEYTYRPLEEAARAFLAKAYAENSGELGTDARNYSWQDLLDSQGDHNQTMIDAIEDTAPTLDAIVTELMSAGSDDAATAWTALLNHVFNQAQKIHEQGSR